MLNDENLIKNDCSGGYLSSVKQSMEKFTSSVVINAQYESRSCLFTASQYNSDPSLIWYLLIKGANPNKVGPGRFETPLVAASRSGMLPTMEILIAYGANASLFHSNALRQAFDGAYEFQKKTAKLLLENGADPDAVDTHSDDEDMRKSPFMTAGEIQKDDKVFIDELMN